MCSYSVISDYYMKPTAPPIQQMDYESIRLLREITQKLDALDKRLKDVECNDPLKKLFEEAIEKRLRDTA